MTEVSPLAPAGFPDMPAIDGVRLAAAAAGVKYRNRVDVLLAEMAPGTTAAGVFTRSLTASAPVLRCRAALADGGGIARGLVVNSGNANAFTGRAGDAAVETCVAATAALLDCPADAVFTASTGVIGEPLPAERITAVLGDLHAGLDADAWAAAAAAIMTTDTFAKGATRSVEIAGTTVTINGIAKGSGMIAPDMATMLAFLFTDAALPAAVLQDLLAPAADRSFNCITVDGDTSTSDSVMLFATGRAGNGAVTDAGDPALAAFRAALQDLMTDLAQQIVRDGEGASKFVTITVTGAEHDEAARRIGLAIANSPLVKTAIAGEDANWGRIVMAVGKAGQRADRDRLTIAMGGHAVAEMGSAVTGYDEGPVAAHMKGREIDIAVDVGVGGGRAVVWTCDLTHGYISINADYRS
ncbi:MAG: bifunctional glutamate N-acetyltransferase/amino-acid acetyltransferase ArgJ [Hyphomicrobiales bacterium]|nr:bifunctional glutamate N-acetyltransferase/amino-acid acetyltransferase ArgJ [Hyphomicrobiales bacterium]